MAKRDLLKLPDDLDGNLRALLNTAPPPHDIPGSRKAAPKPPSKPKKNKARLTPGPEPSQAALDAQARYKRERLMEKLTTRGRPKTAKKP